MDLAIVVAGEPVGMQTVSGFAQWPRRRIVGTSSWVLRPYQRCGLGTRSRAAALELAFGYLRAEAAKSWVLQENRRSRSVSERLGYRVVGSDTLHKGGRNLTELVYRLDAVDWLESPVRANLPALVTGSDGLVDLLAR